MLQEQKRHVVLPVELSEGSDLAVQYYLDYVWREGDVVNLVHVVKASEGTTEIFHGVVGTSLNARDPLAESLEAAAIDTARDGIASRFTQAMDARSPPVLHNLHLFVDTVNAPPSAIAVIVDRVCKELSAAMIVMASSNKGKLEKLFVGSVADYLASNCAYPVLLVR